MQWPVAKQSVKKLIKQDIEFSFGLKCIYTFFFFFFYKLFLLKNNKSLSFSTDLPYGWEQETDEKGQIIYIE